jgi:hypothetical protein
VQAIASGDYAAGAFALAFAALSLAAAGYTIARRWPTGARSKVDTGDGFRSASRTRKLTQVEIDDLKQDVPGATTSRLSQVKITDGQGLGGRPYTLGNTINLGEAYAESNIIGGERGSLLSHELRHVFDFQDSPISTFFGALKDQTVNWFYEHGLSGTNVYDPSLNKSSFTVEGRAMISEWAYDLKVCPTCSAMGYSNAPRTPAQIDRLNVVVKGF